MLWLKFDDPPRRDQEIGRREDQQEQWRCDRQRLDSANRLSTHFEAARTELERFDWLGR